MLPNSCTGTSNNHHRAPLVESLMAFALVFLFVRFSYCFGLLLIRDFTVLEAA